MAYALTQQALLRQAQQSVAAVGLATLGLLAFALVATLVRACIGVARQHELPLGEVPIVAMICNVVFAVQEALVGAMLRGKTRLGQLAIVMSFEGITWVAIVVVARSLGVRDIGAAAVPICLIVFVASRPMVALLRPGQPCRKRLQRTKRELIMGANRLTTLGPGMTVILYVYLTVFKSREPVVEVMVMGLGMPLLQAMLVSLLAWVMGRQERSVMSSIKHRVSRVSRSPQPKDPPTPKLLHGAAQRNEIEPEHAVAGGVAAKAERKAEPKKAGSEFNSRMSLMMVLIAEMIYSTGAFATLALADSDQAFLISLVVMSCIEILQVALYVKAKRVMLRVVTEDTADTLLGDDACIREWLLHQELGEKVGVLVAWGCVAVDKALGRDVQAGMALTPARLAYRGLVMVLFELVGDVLKDLVSQKLGVIPSKASLSRISLSPVGVVYVVLVSVNAACLINIGLALGTPSG